MHYQAVLLICYISEVLHALTHCVIENDNHGKEKVCTGNCSAISQNANVSYITGKVKITFSFRGNCFLFATSQRQDEVGEVISLCDKQLLEICKGKHAAATEGQSHFLQSPRSPRCTYVHH